MWVSVFIAKCAVRINSLPNNKILDWSKLKAFADDKIKLTKKSKLVSGRVENIVGKGENVVKKCWLPAFSSSPTIFRKRFSVEVVKSRD